MLFMLINSKLPFRSSILSLLVDCLLSLTSNDSLLWVITVLPILFVWVVVEIVLGLWFVWITEPSGTSSAPEISERFSQRGLFYFIIILYYFDPLFSETPLRGRWSLCWTLPRSPGEFWSRELRSKMWGGILRGEQYYLIKTQHFVIKEFLRDSRRPWQRRRRLPGRPGPRWSLLRASTRSTLRNNLRK